MIKTAGLTHLHLVVRDLERSLRFYRAVFGMEEQFRVGAHMVFLSTPGSHDLITLNQDEAEQAKAGDNGGIAHFADLDSGCLQHIAERNPVHARRLHGYGRHPSRQQMIAQGMYRLGEGLEHLHRTVHHRDVQLLAAHIDPRRMGVDGPYLSASWFDATAAIDPRIDSHAH